MSGIGYIFLRRLQSLNGRIDWILCQLLWAVFAAMVLLLAIQVAGRYLFGYSAVWVVESSQYLFVWLSFLGVGLAYRRRAHISLEYLWENAPSHLRALTKWLIHASVLAIGWSMAYGGIVLITTFSEALSPGMQIPMAWVYAALVVSGALLCLFDIELALLDLGLGDASHDTSPAND